MSRTLILISDLTAPTSPPATTRPLRADARRNRERVLVAAKVAFAEQGIDAQMDEIARAAGVGVGTVYRHFPTKEALMGELVAAKFEAITARARAALEIEDPWDAFARMVHSGAELMTGDEHMRQAVMRLPDSAWLYAEPQRSELQAVGGAVIARAHDAGVLRRDFTVEHMPMVMTGICAGGSHPGADWRLHVEFLLDGLRAHPAAAS